MQKKMKLQQGLIVFLAIVISLLLVTLLAGRNNTTTIVVVASDKVDTNKKLSDQKQYFQEKKILKSDLEQFGKGVLVTSLSQLEGQYLRFELPVGAPIPSDFLSTQKKSGEFASEMLKNHTVFKIVDGTTALPKEVQPGDKIDVMLTLQPKNKDEGLITGPLLTGVTVKSIDETNVFVYVTQNDFNKLALGQDIGKFVLQLPGQKKDSKLCSAAKEEKSDEEVSCYKESDKPSTVVENELRDFVRNNQALDTTTNDIAEDLDGEQTKDKVSDDKTSDKETTLAEDEESSK